MRLAFCLLKYFPDSGLARDMLRIAKASKDRGHQVVIYAREWQGPKPEQIPVVVVKSKGLSNHGRAKQFGLALAAELANQEFDAVVGFNKIPNLDFYFAADDCYVARAHRSKPFWYRYTPRCRTLCRLEGEVFGARSHARIFLLSENAKLDYRAFYATPEARFRLLPPNLDSTQVKSGQGIEERMKLRQTLGVGAGQWLMLMVGSGFHTKGVDRAIRALASLSAPVREQTRLVVVGGGNPGRYRKLAQGLEVSDRLGFLGVRDDVAELMQVADLLLHPARQESAGAVLLEALAAGLPVLVSGNCGYAFHIERADAGVITPQPFNQIELNHALSGMLDRETLGRFSINATRYGARDELRGMAKAAVRAIEEGPVRNQTAPGFFGYVHDELGALAANTFTEWISTKGDTYRKTRDRETTRFSFAGRRYFIKVHHGVGWREILKNLLQFKLPVVDAGNEWHALHYLMRLGIPTLVPVAYGVIGTNPARRQSFLVTREQMNVVSLEELAQQWDTGDRSLLQRKRDIIRSAASLLRALHENGINHRDMYLCHLLLEKPDDPSLEATRLYLIDLHRAQIRPSTPRRWRVKDIGGLHYSSLSSPASRNDRFRFVREYSGTGSLRAALTQDRGFWDGVDRKAHSLHRSEIRRGYPDPSGRAGASGVDVDGA